MCVFHATDWRAAGKLRHFLRCRAVAPEFPALNPASLAVLPVLKQQLLAAQDRGWQVASRYLARQLKAQLLYFQQQISGLLQVLHEAAVAPPLPPQQDLYQELRGLAADFDGYVVDLRECTLSVITESIVLEEVELGPYRILLQFGERHARDSQPYTVEALEPCYADSRSQIAHPHVMGEQLCEGDAAPAIKQALRDGRLLDFFQIINRVLHTYNGNSPYARLSEWGGVECHSCGTSVTGEPGYCSRCAASVCDDCGTSCPSCDASACDACLQRCARCEERSCPACLQTCAQCDQEVCPTCFSTDDLCQECSDAAQSESLESTPDSTPPQAESDLAAHPLGLGEAAVPA